MHGSSTQSPSTRRGFGRLGAACGAFFAIALAIAGGSGDTAYAPWRFALAGVALVLFLPFLASVCGLLRASGDLPWASPAALGAGVTGIAVKLASGAPEIAAHAAHVASTTQLHKTLQAIADALTVISLYPLALMLAIVAVASLRAAVLPRWLGIGAAITAVALAINGSVPTATAVPALLLFVLWTLAASITLYRRARPEASPVAQAYSAAGA